MKGFVPTPDATVDEMVDLLFRHRAPAKADRLLDPGCGTGQFIDGVIRWCEARSLPCPAITGVELDPRHVKVLSAKYAPLPGITIEHADFLERNDKRYEFIIGNPPYVPITGLSEKEKRIYRANYSAAQGRFDLYILFFEQALRCLVPGGRLVFITPEKYLYVESAGRLRELLSERHIEEIRLASEETFGSLVTYPTITVVNADPPFGTTYVARDGSTIGTQIPNGKASWMPVLMDSQEGRVGPHLIDLCRRISPGVATGADSVFVRRAQEMQSDLSVYARPTVSGRELRPGSDGFETNSVMLLPYDDYGRLLPEDRLGSFREYLREAANEKRLLARTCVARKPWYAFHETPDLPEILRPKILCKDICQTPHFVPDYDGQVVPRHSVYYIVPEDPEMMPRLLEYLRSATATRWLLENCQRAAKGAYRIQSRVLQRLPVPDEMISCRSESTPVRLAKQLTLSV